MKNIKDGTNPKKDEPKPTPSGKTTPQDKSDKPKRSPRVVKVLRARKRKNKEKDEGNGAKIFQLIATIITTAITLKNQITKLRKKHQPRPTPKRKKK